MMTPPTENKSAKTTTSQRDWLGIPIILLAGSALVYYRNGLENTANFLSAAAGALLASLLLGLAIGLYRHGPASQKALTGPIRTTTSLGVLLTLPPFLLGIQPNGLLWFGILGTLATGSHKRHC